MALSFVGAGSASNSTGTDATAAVHASTLAGDFLVALVTFNGQTTIVDANTGTAFTPDINAYQPNTTSGHTVRQFSRVMQGGDPTTLHFTGGASGRWAIIILTFRDTGAPSYDVAPSTTNASNTDDASSGTMVNPSITTGVANTIHVTWGTWDTGLIGTIGTPSGYTLAANANGGGNPLHASYKTIATASATGTTTITNTEFGARIGLSFSVKGSGSSPSASMSPSSSASPSVSPSASLSPSASISPSASASRSQSPSASASRSLSPSASLSPSSSASRSMSPSASLSPSASVSPSSSCEVQAFPLTTNGSNVDGSSYTTASITPGSNYLVLAWVYAIGADLPPEPTLSGNGLTWVNIGTATVGVRRINLYRAMGSSPTTGAVTIDFGGDSQAGCAWSIVHYNNAYTGGTNGDGAIVQVVPDSTASTVNTFTVTLAALSDVLNAVAGGFGIPLNQANIPTIDTGYTSTGQRNQNNPNLSIASEFLATNDTTVTMTSTGFTIPWAAIAVEIRSACVTSPSASASSSLSPSASASASQSPSASISPSASVSPSEPPASTVRQLSALGVG